MQKHKNSAWSRKKTSYHCNTDSYKMIVTKITSKLPFEVFYIRIRLKPPLLCVYLRYRYT